MASTQPLAIEPARHALFGTFDCPLLCVSIWVAQVWHPRSFLLRYYTALLAGQLAGSLVATLCARMLKTGTLHAVPVARMQASPMLLSALLLEGAGQALASLKPLHTSPAGNIPGSSRQKVSGGYTHLPARAHGVLVLDRVLTMSCKGCDPQHGVTAILCDA